MPDYEEIIGYLGEILDDTEDIIEPARLVVQDVYNTLVNNRHPSNVQAQLLVNYMDESNMSPHYFECYKIATECICEIVNQ